MRKIIILGGNGFIGSNLAEELCKQGFRVTIFDYIIDNDLSFISNKKITYVKGDFFSDKDLEEAVVNNDIIVHAICTITPANSNDFYMRAYSSELLQSIKLCDICTRFEKKLLFISSGGTIYGNQEKLPIKENSLSLPINHYGNLKLCIENTYRTFAKQQGSKVLIARISNPYGPGQNAIKAGVGFIDAAIKHALKHSTLQVWGDGKIVRDYIYIKDACRLLVNLIDYGFSSDEMIFNISSNTGSTQNEIIQIVQELEPTLNVIYLPKRSIDVSAIILDNTKIMDLCEEKLIDLVSGIKIYYKYLKNKFTKMEEI